MKKIINKNTIIAFVLGGIIFSTIGISVTAISTYIDSKAVSYTNNSSEVQNVNSALNELYDLSDTGTATAEDINEGKTAIVQGKLITGTRSSNLTVTKIGSAKSWNTLTVNISTSYPEYADFTIDNFFVQPTTWAALSDNLSYAKKSPMSKSYDASTGKITIKPLSGSDGHSTLGFNYDLYLVR